MKQKVVSVLLALVMVLSLLPTAWAEIPAGAGGAAKLNDTVYETLEDAVRLAVSGDTITLLQDVTIQDTLVLDKAVTLDGGAYTITADATVSWKYDPANENSGNKSLINVSGSNAVLENITLDGSDLAGGVRVVSAAATLENITVKNPVFDWVLTVHSAQVTVVGNLTAEGGLGDIELGDISTDGKTSVDITNATLSGINQFWTSADALTYYGLTLDDYDSVYEVIGAAAKGFVKKAVYMEDGTTLRGVAYRNTYGGTATKSDNAAVSVADKSGTLYYDDLAAALDYALRENGMTVALLKNVTVTDTLYLYGGMTIDGGGHTITADGNVSWKFDQGDGNKSLINVYGLGAVVKNVTLDGSNLAGGVDVYSAAVATLENVTVANPVYNWVLTVYGARATVVGNFTAKGVVGAARIELGGRPTIDNKTVVDITKATLTGISGFWTTADVLAACSITPDNYESLFEILGAAEKGFVKKAAYTEGGTLDGVAYVPVVDTTDTTVSDVTIPADKKTVTINATDEDAPNARTATVTIEKDTAKKLKDAAANGTVETVEIKTNVATLTIDKAALNTLTATEGDLVLRVTKSLTGAAETTFILTAQIDGKDVFTSSLGKVTVTVPVDAPGPRQRLVCYYVADDGTRTRMGGAGYQNGSFSWDTNHFSTFVVVTEQVSSSGHSVITINTGKATSATTFDAGVGIYAVGAILSVTGMAWVGKNGKKKS